MSGLLDRLYQSSPIIIQQLMVAVYGYWWHRRRYGRSFQQQYDEFRARDAWSSQDFAEYQAQCLARLFDHAKRSAYYAPILAKLNAPTAFEQLAQFPLLEKETLRVRGRDLLTEEKLSKSTLLFKSSGTTGTPTEIFYPPELHTLEIAIPAARNLGWAGVEVTDRRVMFGVRKVCRYHQDKPPFWRYSPAENMAYASVYHLSPKNLPHYVHFLEEYRPAVIMGYPSALGTIARYALEGGRLLPKVKAIFTTSETVTSQLRAEIETAWQARIFDRYGAVENCMFASQCEYGRYHVSPDAGIVEIIDVDGNPCPPGVPGEVICTGLHNQLQPLIRYRIGDVARWAADQHCPCGRHMPIIEGIEGRYEDICITPDGRELLRFDTVFKGVDAIREAQVVQVDASHFQINLVPTPQFSARDAEKLKENMGLHVGDVDVDIHPLDAIQRTQSGKFKAVICQLNREQKEALRAASQSIRAIG